MNNSRDTDALSELLIHLRTLKRKRSVRCASVNMAGVEHVLKILQAYIDDGPRDYELEAEPDPGLALTEIN